MNKFLVFIFCIFAVISCKSEPKVKNNLDKMPEELPADFVAFYEAFHADSLFQMSRIQFPLRGLRTAEEGPGVRDGVFYHEKETWRMHRPFSEESNFKRRLKILNADMIEELMTDAKGDFGMKRRFAKLGSDWYLIFYSGMNHIAR